MKSSRLFVSLLILLPWLLAPGSTQGPGAPSTGAIGGTFTLDGAAIVSADCSGVGTCTQGDECFESTDMSWWYCEATNTWVPRNKTADLVSGGGNLTGTYTDTGSASSTPGTTLWRGCTLSGESSSSRGYCDGTAGVNAFSDCVISSEADDCEVTAAAADGANKCVYQPNIVCPASPKYNFVASGSTIQSATEHAIDGVSLEYSFTDAVDSNKIERNFDMNSATYEVDLGSVSGEWTVGDVVRWDDNAGGDPLGRGKIAAVRILVNLLADNDDCTAENAPDDCCTALNAGHCTEQGSWAVSTDPPINSTVLGDLVGIYEDIGDGQDQVAKGYIQACGNNCTSPTSLTIDIIEGASDLALAYVIMNLQPGTGAVTDFAYIDTIATDPTHAWIVHLSGAAVANTNIINEEGGASTSIISNAASFPYVHRQFQWTSQIDDLLDGGIRSERWGNGELRTRQSAEGFTAGFDDGASVAGINLIGASGIANGGIQIKNYARGDSEGSYRGLHSIINVDTVSDFNHSSIAAARFEIQLRGAGEDVDFTALNVMELNMKFANTGSLSDIGNPDFVVLEIDQDLAGLDATFASEIRNATMIHIDNPINVTGDTTMPVGSWRAISIDNMGAPAALDNTVLRVEAQDCTWQDGDSGADVCTDGDWGNAAWMGGDWNTGHLMFGDDEGDKADHFWRDQTDEVWRSSTDDSPQTVATDGDVFVQTPNGKATVGTMMWSDGVAAAEDTGTEVCALVGLSCIDTRLLSAMQTTVTCATDHAGAYFAALCAVP